MTIKGKVYPFLIGVFCTFNFYIVQLDFLKTPRVFDVFSIVFIVFYLFIFLIKGKIIINNKYFILLELIFLWLISDLIRNGYSSLLITGRWLTIGIFIYFFNHYYLDFHKESLFLKGIIYGLFLNVGVIFLQINGYTSELMKYGFVPKDRWLSYIGEIPRYTGLFQYPNAAAFVLGLGLPISIILIEKYKENKIYLLYGIILSILSYTITYTRTPIAISFVVFIFWLIGSNSRLINKKHRIIALFFIIFIGIYFINFRLSSRWTNIDSILYNLNQRLTSIKMASNYILKYPFGMGTNFKEVVKYAVHNAYLQIALLAGGHFLLYLIFYIVFKFIEFTIRERYYIWLILYLVMNFMFEEHLTNPVIVLVLLWVISKEIKLRNYKKHKVVNNI